MQGYIEINLAEIMWSSKQLSSPKDVKPLLLCKPTPYDCSDNATLLFSGCH